MPQDWQPKGHSNTCDLVGWSQGYAAPAACSCGFDERVRAYREQLDAEQIAMTKRLRRSEEHAHDPDPPSAIPGRRE